MRGAGASGIAEPDHHCARHSAPSGLACWNGTPEGEWCHDEQTAISFVPRSWAQSRTFKKGHIADATRKPYLTFYDDRTGHRATLGWTTKALTVALDIV
jgi:hypothetical protein